MFGHFSGDGQTLMTSARRIADADRPSGSDNMRAHLPRVLALSTMLPYPATNGIQMRTWQTLLALKSIGCEINLLTFGDPAALKHIGREIRDVCNTVEAIPHSWTNASQNRDYLGRLRALPSSLPFSVSRFRSSVMRKRVEEWVDSRAIDWILSETIYPLVNLPSEVPPVVVNCHNAEHLILRRYLQCESNILRKSYAWLESKKLEKFEQEFCSRANVLVVCSEYDGMVMQGLCAGATIAVVPNAVDIGRYSPSAGADGETILYTGGMDWFPNRDAVEFFATKILPEVRELSPKAKFVVAGRPGPDEFHRWLSGIPHTEFHGPVADMSSELARAAVCVVPLRIGSGTRLKILEAGAAGKPIVSTRVGAEGLKFEDGAEICIADQPTEFVNAVNMLLNDPERRGAMGSAARRKVERCYTYDAVRQSLAEALVRAAMIREESSIA